MIYLTQWLCPDRHASIALAWDEADHTAAEMVENGEAAFRSKMIDRVCGLCGGELTPETAPTKFATLEEALPSLLREQEANMQTRLAVQRARREASARRN